MCAAQGCLRLVSSLIRAHLDLLGQQRGFEVGLDDHLNLQFSAANLPDQRNNSERQDDVFSGAIPARKGEENMFLTSHQCVKLFSNVIMC